MLPTPSLFSSLNHLPNTYYARPSPCNRRQIVNLQMQRKESEASSQTLKLTDGPPSVEASRIALDRRLKIRTIMFKLSCRTNLLPCVSLPLLDSRYTMIVNIKQHTCPNQPVLPKSWSFNASEIRGLKIRIESTNNDLIHSFG